jgi:hypothetical protein
VRRRGRGEKAVPAAREGPETTTAAREGPPRVVLAGVVARPPERPRARACQRFEQELLPCSLRACLQASLNSDLKLLSLFGPDSDEAPWIMIDESL